VELRLVGAALVQTRAVAQPLQLLTLAVAVAEVMVVVVRLATAAPVL
jgi:NADH:ubiquinone oxidoreductase subunit K